MHARHVNGENEFSIELFRFLNAIFDVVTRPSIPMEFMLQNCFNIYII